MIILLIFIEKKIDSQFVINLIINSYQKSWTHRRTMLENTNVLN